MNFSKVKHIIQLYMLQCVNKKHPKHKLRLKTCEKKQRFNGTAWASTMTGKYLYDRLQTGTYLGLRHSPYIFVSTREYLQ